MKRETSYKLDQIVGLRMSFVAFKIKDIRIQHGREEYLCCPYDEDNPELCTGACGIWSQEHMITGVFE